MRNAEYDHYLTRYFDDDSGRHAHYVSSVKPDPDDQPDLQHGQPIFYFTDISGDWYAVHTH